MELNKKTRDILLITAGAILMFALAWTIFRGNSGGLNVLCRELNSYGYNFIPDDLLIAFDSADTSIAEELNDVNMDDVIEASRRAGFGSDINRVGGVTLMLAHIEEDVLTVYLLDGKIELCFIQDMNGGIRAIGE